MRRSAIKHTLGTLHLTEQDIQSAAEIIDSNWLSPGPKVAEFEQAFSSIHHQKYGHMVNSGTDALRIALAALKEKYGWKDGDAVIVPAVTFVATVNVVLQLNLRPLLADVSMYDFNLNPENLERLHTSVPFGKGEWMHPENRKMHSKIKCIIPVHLGGKPCNMKKIMEIARRYNLTVLEDSCETMGVPGIAQGDVTAFSFYVAHLLTTGVGGMATTNDRELYKLIWSYANHGRREPKKFQFDRIGYSCRPTEFEAAIGLNQLPSLDHALERRRWNARYLFDRLSRFRAIQMNYFPESAYMFFPIMVAEHQKFTKWDLMDHLAKCSIESREILPLINQPCYKGLWNTTNGYSVAKSVNERGFYMGCHQGMKKTGLDEIIDAFTEFFRGKIK